MEKGSEQFSENGVATPDSRKIALTRSSPFAMPFGAELFPGGGVRFRLWAPGAGGVEVVLEKKALPLEKREGGWFERVVAEARAGTLYKYRIDGKHEVPDPASRFQPKDVSGPSEVVDPEAFRWNEGGWQGRPWQEAVIYEVHVGTFSSKGSYRGVVEKIDYLRELGITAIELMPLADFSGRRNWGYDGVLPFAPDSSYGRPEDLKGLVQAAHRAGLMVFLDVVYNHLGPEGNYLHLYAPQFFTDRHHTPWGAAIDFSNPAVRSFFVHNARYWLEEYRFDGLRFDAVHAIVDTSQKHILDEIREGVDPEKHLVLENDANQAGFLQRGYRAQWNDDAHHAYHVLATGEGESYYADYAEAPARHLARSLAEGFAYQGDHSKFRNRPRGEKSAHLPPAKFVNFLQNHDQIGNRALGERLVSLAEENKVRALAAILLLSPSPPLLFMGEEWGCRQPFLFFCDFHGELGEAVREGRQREFPHFRHAPDPLAEQTFKRSQLRWKDCRTTEGVRWLAFYKGLLELRRAHLSARAWPPGSYRMLSEHAFEARWGDLLLLANCGNADVPIPEMPNGRQLWGSLSRKALDPWSVNWWIGT
jgi:malto-oligosyltrehalose trehalohydrolase